MDECVLVGEGMIELARGHDPHRGWQMGHGGDTLNMAVHLARFGRSVGYLTALGDDPFSARLRGDWTDEGLDIDMALTIPGATPGLYAISTDENGERSFTYWRSDSAARRLFDAPGIEAALARAYQARLLAFSLISLAVLPEDGRAALIATAEAVRANGGTVAFDGNYRPRLWGNTGEARRWRDRAVAVSTIGLPTREDEAMIDGEASASDMAARWRALGAGEVVVKLGPDGCLLPDGSLLAPPFRLAPRDTSGAGDAFDAGYLHARLSGMAPADAARLGHRLAAWVVMRAGALPAVDTDAPYRR